MKFPKLNIIWLILPSIVFVLLVAAFILRLNQRAPNTSENPAPTPLVLATPTSEPVVVEGLPSLLKQIQGFELNDPRLVPPALDRKVSLPVD